MNAPSPSSRPTQMVARASGLLCAVCIASAGLAPSMAGAQSETRVPPTFPNPNVTTGFGSVTLNFGGQAFVNQGLVASGAVSALALDGLGHTLGSLSDLALDLTNWRRSGSTYFGGILIALPDRGFNSGAVYSDYTGRLQRYSISLTPTNGTGAAPADSLSLGFQSTQRLVDNTGADFTGVDPGTGSRTVLGALVPTPATGLGAGKIALDSEGLAFRRDGSFYVSDEYAANIYYFDASGRLQGIIAPPAALAPRTAGAVNFNSIGPPGTGRRNNQGLEGLTITPDGKKLVSLLQSAAVQDGTNRQNTRLMIYDISTNALPSAPSEHYVLTLPLTPGATAAAAQSSILALNSKQFLVLSRDGTGLGNGTTVSNGGTFNFKSILLVDTAGATNIAGTAFETGTTAVAPGGALLSTITPTLQAQFINILNSDQLGRFGVNLNANNTQNAASLSSKWEALGLAPALDPARPNDYFLFTGNDNDFQSTNCTMPLAATGAVAGNCASTFNNDQRILVYRITLPTYVDPAYLLALETAGRATADAVRRVSVSGAQSLHQAYSNFVMGEWVRPNRGFSDKATGFVNGELGRVEGSTYDSYSGNVGVEWPLSSSLRIGAAFGASHTDGKFGAGSSLKANRAGGSLHLRHRGEYTLSRIGVSHNSDDFDDIRRADPFGLTATGSTTARTLGLTGEIAFPRAFGSAQWQPYVGADLFRTTTKGYTETGAAGGDIRYPETKSETGVLRGGVHWVSRTDAPVGAWVPSARVELSTVVKKDGDPVNLTLANVSHVDATQSVSQTASLKDSIGAQLAVTRLISATSALSIGVNIRTDGDKSAYSAWVGMNIGF